MAAQFKPKPPVNPDKPAPNADNGSNGVDKREFPIMLQKYKAEIAKALPKHMNVDRMTRIALTAFRQTPKLAECDPLSVFAAVIQSSQLGLEVGLMGEAHLVPFNKRINENGKWINSPQCQLIPGYQGLMKLARNTGQIADIYAHAVRLNDTFDIVFGLEQTLIHEPLKNSGFPASDEERGEIVGFYAVAVFKDGARHFEAMSRRQVESIRDSSSGYQAAVKAAQQYNKNPETPWVLHFEAMGIKTVIRRLSKLLPKSPELIQALALDNQAEKGQAQNLTINDAIEGTWVPADDPESKPEPELPEPEPRLGPPADGPTLGDAIVAARDGDFDVARDIARGLSSHDRNQVEAEITNVIIGARRNGNANKDRHLFEAE